MKLRDLQASFRPSSLDLGCQQLARWCATVEDRFKARLSRECGRLDDGRDHRRHTKSQLKLASCHEKPFGKAHPPITVTFSSMINPTASAVFHFRIMTILLPPKKARMSHERQPVTWKRGIASRTVFCGCVGSGRGGGWRPARRAARDGAKVVSFVFE